VANPIKDIRLQVLNLCI